MLVHLGISNLVLIEQLSLDLDAGFNVLTGETGAGKSMIVDALSLVLGGRARPDMVRASAKEAEVEALFELDRLPRVRATLQEAGVDAGNELSIRRVVQSEGRSRSWINGKLCTAAQLTALGEELCDIASQHESVGLTNPASHLQYLDAFGTLEGMRIEVEQEFDALVACTRQLETLVSAERNRAEREDFLRFQLRDVEELGVRAGEESELEQERGRLRHAERLTQATRGASDRLYEGEGAICDELGRIVNELDHAASIDSSLQAVVRTIEQARAELSDVSRELTRYADAIDSNPARLAEVEERLFRLQRLLRKYGPTSAELLQHQTQWRNELESFEGAADRIAELESQRTQLLARAGKKARQLSKARRESAERLADAIGRELSQLGMGRARIVVDVASLTPSGEEGLTVDGVKLTRSGLDRVEFLIAPNRGEEPRPLRRIASGGELSRSLLALKRALADQGPACTYVFDEVDAGVSGAIAEVIGRAILDIGRHRQVVCITHLPQIAALARSHFVVGKAEQKGRTFTTVRRLCEAERVEEIARMLGGVRVSEATRRAAAEMLSTPS